MIGRPSRRSGSDREALPEGREWSGGHPGGSGLVERPFQRAGVVGRPSQRARSGRKVLLEGREWLGMVGRSFWRVRSGWESLHKGQE